MELDWSKWFLFPKSDWSNIPKKAGVYQFRCLEDKGNPINVSRLRGIDREGVIYIGSSDNLRKRISDFWKTIELQDRNRHAAAWTYYSFNYYPIFPCEHLQFRYSVTNKTATSEFDLLIDYRKKFMDFPPLNSNRPPYPGDWKVRMERVFGRRPI